MTRDQAIALAQHAISRSTTPTPLLVRLALWQYRATLARPAQDQQAAEKAKVRE